MADQRLGVDLPVAGVQHRAEPGGDGQRIGLGDRMGDRHEFDGEGPERKPAAQRHDVDMHLVRETGLGQLGLDQMRGEGGGIDRAAQIGPKMGHRADVILPGAAYTEKSGHYANFEGRVQRGERAAFPPGDAKEDWAILRALSDVLGKTLPYDNVDALRAAMLADVPHFADVGTVPARPGADPAIWNAIGADGAVDKSAPLASPIADFYLTNPIARASEVMAECSRIFVNGATQLAAE